MKTRIESARGTLAEPRSETALRIATALLISFATVLVLLHAQAYAGGLPRPAAPVWGAAASTAYPR